MREQGTDEKQVLPFARPNELRSLGRASRSVLDDAALGNGDIGKFPQGLKASSIWPAYRHD